MHSARCPLRHIRLAARTVVGGHEVDPFQGVLGRDAISLGERHLVGENLELGRGDERDFESLVQRLEVGVLRKRGLAKKTKSKENGATGVPPVARAPTK